MKLLNRVLQLSIPIALLMAHAGCSGHIQNSTEAIPAEALPAEPIPAMVSAVPGMVMEQLLDNNKAIDTSGYGNNGTVTGYGQTGTSPHDLSAMFFNGSTYLTVPNSSSINVGTGDFSISTWFTTASSQGNNTIIDKRDNSGNGYHVCLYEGHILLQMSGYNYWSSSSPSFIDNYSGDPYGYYKKWHFLVITVDRDNPSGIVFYVDGKVIYTGDPRNRTGSLTNTAPLYIGKHKDSPSNNYKGWLAEVRLFNRALPYSQLNPQGNVLQIPIWEEISIGGGFKDRSGYGNDGTGYCGYPRTLFNGSNYVQVPNSTSLNFGTGAFSIRLGFCNTSSKTINTLIDKRDGSSTGYHVCFYQGHILLQMNGYNYWDPNSPVYLQQPLGEWHDLAITVNRQITTGIKFYVDGALIYTGNPTNIPSSISNSADLLIGKHKNDPTSNYEGLLENVRLYNRVLGASELQPPSPLR